MEALYDAVVVGGGPAGLTAAIYLARAGYRVVVLEKERLGGQIAITEEVVNYPGIPSIGGAALTEAMRRQAERFGAEFLQDEAVGFSLAGDVKTVRTARTTLRCLGVVLAVGAHPRSVGFIGESEYRGRGVAYCATCDGEFFTDCEVFVVGGGYAAAEESVFLTRFARHVTILIRKNDFSCPASVAEIAKKHEKITVLTNTVLEEVSGRDGLTYARWKNTETGEVTEHRSPSGEHFGVFVLAGYAPATETLRDTVTCNEQGCIVTDAAQKTNIDGVYAAGDVCVKPLRQVVTATGDGAIAATALEKYLADLARRTGLHAERPKAEKRPAPTERPAAEHPAQAAERSEATDTPFDDGVRRQLDELFVRMPAPLVLRLYLDERPISEELRRFIASLCATTERLTLQISDADEASAEAPCVKVCDAEGRETGLAFHGVPGGHEFQSFVMGLYHASGAGQPLSDDVRRRIASIDRPQTIRVLVTLSCGFCPDTVIAAQRIAAENPNVTAEVYDIRHFEALRERYRVMSVPCVVINDDPPVFGKKSIEELLSLLIDG